MQLLSINLQANSGDSADNCLSLKRHSIGKIETRTDNTGLAKVAVQYSEDTFGVNQPLVLRINICGENRHLR
jgi:hypothetical protein